MAGLPRGGAAGRVILILINNRVIYYGTGVDGSASASMRAGPALRSDRAERGARRVPARAASAHAGGSRRPHTEHSPACQLTAITR